ncbi:MAG: hypothetical protein KF696_16050 [Planctomycetes bacterium]|nr:hypothetical protein [Planctomycetota bacterium]MCW8137247.1 hypothetical protein [Planctomycetota bacterium]
MRYLPLIALLLLASCRNVPQERREGIRATTQAADPAQHEQLRAQYTSLLLGDASQPADEDPHVRAAAAQALGNLGYPDDTDTLIEAMAGPLADESVQVRLECAIALGKLRFAGVKDARRIEAIRVLRGRVAFDRDTAGRPMETEFMVRSAMLDSLVNMGGRSAAVAIHDVATRINADLESMASALTAATDKGLLDRCFSGLCDITGVPPRDAAANRLTNEDNVRHLQWWADQISRLPDS